GGQERGFAGPQAADAFQVRSRRIQYAADAAETAEELARQVHHGNAGDAAPEQDRNHFRVGKMARPRAEQPLPGAVTDRPVPDRAVGHGGRFWPAHGYDPRTETG